MHLNELDAILLSHGHYDHTGALAMALETSPGMSVFLHPEALDEKYMLTKAGTSRFIGTPEPIVNHVRERANLCWIEEPTRIHSRMYLTGPIPRVTDFEDTGGLFFRDAACQEPDLLSDDQAAYVETADGLVVILGCAHAGVINALQYVKKLTQDAPIHTIIGGMHLMSAGSDRIDRTIAELKRLHVRRVIPLHCTGFWATARFCEELSVQSALCSIGTILEYD